MNSERDFNRKPARSHDRPSAEGGFHWTANDACVLLDRWFDDAGDTFATKRKMAFALYYTFTRLTYELNAEEFTYGIKDLGKKAGMCEGAVKLLLPILKEVGLIAILQIYNAEIRQYDKSRYKVLSVRGAKP
jgi:hypothetical protein